MANTSSLRTSDRPVPRPAVPETPKNEATDDTLVERLIRARTANELSIIAGLRPIKGRSGPKIAY